jgi:hypothetical protein
MKKIIIYRHGDLGIAPIAKFPENLIEVGGDGFVLAVGKTTGHGHVIVKERPESEIKVYKDSEGRHYLKIEKGNAVITHEEHEPMVLQPGIYIQDIQREFDGLEELRRVRD